MKSLEVLDFANNKIELLEDDCFFGLSKLKNLLLENNQLTRLRLTNFKDLLNLEEFLINENPLWKTYHRLRHLNATEKKHLRNY